MNDLISRQAAIDIERNATVDTNPSHFEAHQKFTQFMDDAEVSSFGRWQWSNGFNTALTAVGIDLKKLPSAQPEILACGEGELNVPDTNVGDMISRQAAIDALHMHLMYRMGTDSNKKRLDEWINNLPSAQPEPKWIPCSERLPYAEYGESDNVLATCGYRDVEDGSIRWIKTLYFNGGNWCYPTGETYLEKVYAWMPLPEPYRGGEKE